MSDITTCDLLVIGSGGAGLTAAITAKTLGLDVLIVEKEPVYGGTTARSGGWLWIPANPKAEAVGIKDSKEQARLYLQAETGNRFDAARVDAFLDNGPDMIRFLESQTGAVRFDLGETFSDYHPDQPGGMAGGRSICASAFDARELGEEVKRLSPPLPELTFLGMMIGSNKELLHFFNMTKSLKSALYVGKLLARFVSDHAFHGRPMRLTNGNALVGRLAKAVFDLGIPLWTSSPVKQLIEDQGRITGAIIEKDGVRQTIHARKAVILAAGGFPYDTKRRAALYPHAPTGKEHWSPAPESNTGDGVALGETAGGHTAKDYPNAAAWVPVSLVPRRDGTIGKFPHFIDRQKPGVIAVNKSGKRFVNEAHCYHDFIQGLFASLGPDEEKCAWLVADHTTLRKYGLGFAKPFPVPLFHQIRSGYLLRGRTLEELATKAGFDAAAFRQTVEHFNIGARRGEDPDFGRGTTAYNRYLGDASHKPNPCVKPIEDGPFYAIKVVPGDLGSFSSLITNEHAQVLDEAKQPISGLYAIGNDMASIMGGNYPGGGITLGPGMTFAYIAARHIAGVTDSATATPGVAA